MQNRLSCNARMSFLSQVAPSGIYHPKPVQVHKHPSISERCGNIDTNLRSVNSQFHSPAALPASSLPNSLTSIPLRIAIGKGNAVRCRNHLGVKDLIARRTSSFLWNTVQRHVGIPVNNRHPSIPKSLNFGPLRVSASI